jgi:hypothetical protein
MVNTRIINSYLQILDSLSLLAFGDTVEGKHMHELIDASLHRFGVATFALGNHEDGRTERREHGESAQRHQDCEQ